MKFTPICLLTMWLLSSGLGISVASATEGAEDVSIRLKGDPVVYTQKNRVEVFELRGDRKDPNFFERSWASTQIKEQERQREKVAERTPEKLPERLPERQKKRATNKVRAAGEVAFKHPAKRNKTAVASKKNSNGTPASLGSIVKLSQTTDQVKGPRLKD